ncbi:MAG: hypothetical protein HYV15_07000 [Elusimicrobia bacterium]|nr:hypothetical protein [Elusimicrobiota bacterium]
MRQSAIMLDEFEVVSKAIAQDGRIVSLVYLNRYGEVRWFRDRDSLRGGCRFYEDFRPAEEPLSWALLEAYRTRKMALSRKLKGRFVEVAWPIVRGGDVLGVLDAHAEVGTGKTDWSRDQSSAGN